MSARIKDMNCPHVKGGYFPVPSVDSSHDLRNAMCESLMAMGLVPEAHHHEVTTCDQNEITTRYNTLLPTIVCNANI